MFFYGFFARQGIFTILRTHFLHIHMHTCHSENQCKFTNHSKIGQSRKNQWNKAKNYDGYVSIIVAHFQCIRTTDRIVFINYDHCYFDFHAFPFVYVFVSSKNYNRKIIKLLRKTIAIVDLFIWDIHQSKCTQFALGFYFLLVERIRIIYKLINSGFSLFIGKL